MKICHLPKKKKKPVAVSSYNHSAGEAETDGSLGTLSVSLTYLMSMKFSDILSQKSRWKIPEEQHLKLTSSLHMLIHIHTLFPKHSKSRALNTINSGHLEPRGFNVWYVSQCTEVLSLLLPGITVGLWDPPLEHLWNPGFTNNSLLSAVTKFWIHLVLYQGAWFLCLESDVWEPQHDTRGAHCKQIKHHF